MISENENLKVTEKGETWLGSSEVWAVTYQGVQGSFIIRRWWGLSSVPGPNSCACWYWKGKYTIKSVYTHTPYTHKGAVLIPISNKTKHLIFPDENLGAREIFQM